MIYCISDIHGNIDAFHSILKKINFSDKDRLYILGDVIDRWPHGIKLLLEIMNMKNAELILGNHEVFLRDWFNLLLLHNKNNKNVKVFDQLKRIEKLWINNGGSQTLHDLKQLILNDYNKSLKLLIYIYQSRKQLHLTCNNKDFILRHNLSSKEYEKYLDDNNEYYNNDHIKEENFILWNREYLFQNKLYKKNEFIIFGHTPISFIYDILINRYYTDFRIKSSDELLEAANLAKKEKLLKIFHWNNFYDIDCGAGFPHGGRLACLCLDTMEEFYSI